MNVEHKPQHIIHKYTDTHYYCHPYNVSQAHAHVATADAESGTRCQQEVAQEVIWRGRPARVRLQITRHASLAACDKHFVAPVP